MTPRESHRALGADEDRFEGLRSSTIVMVDDEPTTLEVLEALLEEEGYCNIFPTTDSTRALALIEARNPDVVLLDLVMPEVDGFEILAALRASAAFAHTPVIVLTSATDPATKLQALEHGATDFLAKPVDPSELALRLRNTLAAKAFQDRLARYDALTGLPNRTFFLELLARLLDRTDADSSRCAVLHIDIDRFKQINDALGPPAGDSVLKMVAERLEACLRSSDLIGVPGLSETGEPLSRLGGDEFSLLLPDIGSADRAERVARRVQAELAKPINLRDQQVFVTASIGIAIFPDDGRDVERLVQSADTAVCHAKRGGAAGCQFYSPPLNSQSRERLSLENDLRRALERGELSLQYQPKIDLRTGRLVGAEALMRWQHPRHGWISPVRFIPLAEDAGLITLLGEWALRESALQAAAWQSAEFGPLRVSVNVSPLQFRPGLRELVLRAVEDASLEPDRLVIEITEGMIMHNADHAGRLLSELKDQGLKVSIDDFGTGYSSLERLKRLPLDEVKIDHSFVKGVPSDSDDAAIVTAIVALAHSLDLTVVAEGIETEAQLDFLYECGCEEYQGFLCSPAIPASEWPQHVEEWSRVGERAARRR